MVDDRHRIDLFPLDRTVLAHQWDEKIFALMINQPTCDIIQLVAMVMLFQFVFVRLNIVMIFKLFSSKYYPTHESNKTRSELISLITEPLALQHGEPFSSVAIVNNDDGVSASAEEVGNLQVCRICYSTSDLQSLIAPCECSGTMGILHRNCLERWLEISNTTKCEICQHEYEVTRYPKSLLYFFISPLRSSDIRYLVNDVTLFSVLTVIISWLSVVSLFKIWTARTIYEMLSYIPLPLAIIFIYVVWCWVSFRYHIQVIREWRSLNQQIRVINKKENKVTSTPDGHCQCAGSHIHQHISFPHLLNSNGLPVTTHANEQNASSTTQSSCV